MRVNINCGHTLKGADTGTRAYHQGTLYAEEVYTRLLGNELKNVLVAAGHIVNMSIVDYAATLDESLSKQTELCNSFTADINICLHFNACASHEGRGIEIFTYQGKSLPQAQSILRNYESLGFVNRGIKQSNLYLINETSAETLYVENCFIDNINDVNLMNSAGLESMARAIANGIDNNINLEVNKEEDVDMGKIVVFMGDVDKRAAEYLADYLVCPCMDGRRTPYDYSKYSEVYCVGGEKGQFTGYCTNHITGTNRYNTMQAVLNFIG